MSEAVSGVGDGPARDPAAGAGTPAAVLVGGARETWRAGGMGGAVAGAGAGPARDPAAGAGTPAAVLVEAARETWRADSRADAARLAACYALWRQCERDLVGDDDAARPGHAVIDPFDVCCTHLAAAFAMSCGRAETM